MSFPSSVNKSLFHQIMVLFIPGSVVVIPFMLIAHIPSPIIGFDNLFSSIERKGMDHFAVYTMAFILIFLTGVILENIGSWLEDQHFDKNLDGVKGKHIDTSAWRYYLFSKCEDSNTRVFHKYIDSIVFRYKLELSLIPALALFLIEWVGIWAWILIHYQQFRNMTLFFYVFISVITIIIPLTIWFTWAQAKTSCSYLNDLRISFMAVVYKDNVTTGYKNTMCENCKDIVFKSRCTSCGQ